MEKLKKAVFFTVLISIMLFSAAFLFCQEEEQDIFVKTVRLNKVYTHPSGYKVQYFSDGGFDSHSVYLPAEWFYTAGGKGDLIWGEEKTYPYMDVFWIDGEFSHVRLYLPSYTDHIAWGVLEEPDATDTFSSTEEVKLEF